MPTPQSAPWEIAAGPDGALWFTELLGNKIGRITTDGQGRNGKWMTFIRRKWGFQLVTPPARLAGL